jgi:hypothetical protein
MCKIIVITNAAKLKIKTDAKKIAAIMNASQRDGFGYAVQGKAGVFGERTTKPASFTSRFGKPKNDLPWVQATSETFGEISPIIGAAIFHGRTSTNEVSLINTHPLEKNDWHLIHNGVVNNVGEKYEMQSTNDSEHVLHYLSRDGLHGVAANLTGYYAVAAISPENRLHIFKDDTARLFSGYSKKLDSYIFGTSLDILDELCVDLKLGEIIFEPMLSNTSLVFEGNTLLSTESFKPRGMGYAETKYSGQSLGYDVGHVSGSSSFYGSKNKYQSTVSPLVQAANASDEKLDAFYNEIDDADASYTFFNRTGELITQEEWEWLSPIAQSQCTIKRSDGTLVDIPDSVAI